MNKEQKQKKIEDFITQLTADIEKQKDILVRIDRKYDEQKAEAQDILDELELKLAAYKGHKI